MALGIGAALALAGLAKETTSTYSDIYEQEPQLRGDTMSWWQRAIPIVAGPVLGGEIYSHLVSGKLQEQQAQRAEFGRASLAGEFQTAAESQMIAERQEIQRALASALRRVDIGYGQGGTYGFGARATRREELEEAAGRDLSSALARTGLQRLGIQQQAIATERTAALQQAQLQMAADSAKAQQYSSIGQSLAPIIMTWLMNREGGGQQASPYAGMDTMQALSQANPDMDWYQVEEYTGRR